MTYEALIAKGFVWTGTGACHKCGAALYWFRTFNDKHQPYERVGGDYVLHFILCGKAKAPKISAEELAAAYDEAVKENAKRDGLLPIGATRGIYLDDERPTAEQVRQSYPQGKPEPARKSVRRPGQYAMDFDSPGDE